MSDIVTLLIFINFIFKFLFALGIHFVIRVEYRIDVNHLLSPVLKKNYADAF